MNSTRTSLASYVQEIFLEMTLGLSVIIALIHQHMIDALRAEASTQMSISIGAHNVKTGYQNVNAPSAKTNRIQNRVVSWEPFCLWELYKDWDFYL